LAVANPYTSTGELGKHVQTHIRYLFELQHMSFCEAELSVFIFIASA